MPVRITLAKIDQARKVVSAARRRPGSTVKVRTRKLRVPPMEKTEAYPVTLSAFPHDNPPPFEGYISGALIGRIMLPTGEYIRIFNPTTMKWENYLLSQFSAGFFTLSAGIKLGHYAIVGDVFHSSSGTDYCKAWMATDVQIVLRMI